MSSLKTVHLTLSRKNIGAARDDLMEELGGFFVPKQDDPLFEWLRDAKGYSIGQRVEAENFTLNTGNRQMQLSIRAAYMLRHIFFSYNLPCDVVPALWSCFYALIMHRPISEVKFASATAVWNNTMLLRDIDNEVATKKFSKAIRKKTKHGFQQYFYLSANDSKHFKRNRHVLVLSSFEDDEQATFSATPADPTFRHVTSSVSMVKSSNSTKNAADIIDLLGLPTAAFIAGGTNDNAADAQVEISETCNKIWDEVERSDDEEVKHLRIVNGVRRRPIVFGDPFHWANLAVMYASKGMAGDTVNGEHEQIHHRQLLMSMHSLHSDD